MIQAHFYPKPVSFINLSLAIISGETWMDKSFKFRCDEGGQTKFIACVTADGSEIPASGSAMVILQIYFFCFNF